MFRIYTKTSLTNSVGETCYRWAINNYTNKNKINIITILIINLKSKIFSNKDNFIPIHYYQISKINDLDKENINNINSNTVALL